MPEVKDYYFLFCVDCNDRCKIAKYKGYWQTFNPEWISDFFLFHAGHIIQVINSEGSDGKEL